MKLRFLKLMLLLFILPLQMLAAELGVTGKQLAALPGVSNVETLKSTHFPEKYVFFIKQQLDAKDYLHVLSTKRCREITCSYHRRSE